jgi:predicted secreted Zn-dependent protease
LERPFVLSLARCLAEKEMYCMSTVAPFSKEGPVVRLDLRRSFSPVIGSTASQLRAVLWTLGPVRQGRRFGAFTDWEIVWRYRQADDRGGCRIHEASTEVRATITSPLWKPPRSAPGDLVAAWREYVVAIETHEQGHLALAVEAAKTIWMRMIALPALPSKTALADAANAVAEEELRAARAREILYDQITGHGVTQGVVFPSENACSDESAEPDQRPVNARAPSVIPDRGEAFQ